MATIPDVTPLSSTPKEQLLRREQPETLLGFLEPKAEMDPKGSERIRKDPKGSAGHRNFFQRDEFCFVHQHFLKLCKKEHLYDPI